MTPQSHIVRQKWTKMREMAYPAENPERNPFAADIMGLYLYLMSDLSQKITGQSIDAQGS